jgi:hypothetical protein
MLVHPRCPCTGASLDELQGVLDRCGRSVEVDLLIYRPSGHDGPAWDGTALLRGHPALDRHNVSLTVDLDGIQARRLGLTTSGHLLAFDSDGNVRFSGGLTALRGHSLAGAGVESVTSIIEGAAPAVTVRPVFGCSILNEPDSHSKVTSCQQSKNQMNRQSASIRPIGCVKTPISAPMRTKSTDERIGSSRSCCSLSGSS